MTRPGRPPRTGRFGAVLSALVLLLGLAATALSALALYDVGRDNARRAMDQRTAVVRRDLVTQADRHLDLVRAAAAGLGLADRITAESFRHATLPLDRAQLTGATSAVLVVPAATGEVPAVQQQWRDRGSADLTLAPQPAARQHYFSVFSRRLGSRPPSPLGLDLSASPEAVAALEESRRTGAATVSDAYILLVDRTLPQDRQQHGIVVAAPVYGPATPGATSGEFRGWLITGVRLQELLDAVLGTGGQGLLGGELRVVSADGRAVRAAAYDARTVPDATRQATFPVGKRHWTLVTTAVAARLPGAQTPLPAIVAAGGVLTSVLLAWLVHVLATGRARAQAGVERATAELRAAEAEARRQAGLLSAVMASIGDGVGVVDEHGRILLHNPAARELLTLDDDGGGYRGLYLPDGTTPFPPQDLPFARGLRGESVNGVEMTVRNERHPDGLLLSVDGRPLDPSAGQNGAVAVFHDVTELRRYEHDLSVFAGVVAHDLKAPLAVIRGHCELAADLLADAPQSSDVAEARTGLGRISGAVDRMAALIDTLLAYTTARDAPLRLRAVDLGKLVAEVVAERTGHLRPGTHTVPDIYVGPLPSVTADPDMLRHVVDNLVGNALKYVPPGRHPRVDIAALPAAPGRVRLEVADRGIGVPDEDKPRIFESFHRAHRQAGYAGTGLGLAICKRIVERHGGAITVADNPGGGTRFQVTLAAAPTGPAPADVADPPGTRATDRDAAAPADTPAAPADTPAAPAGTPAASAGTPAGPDGSDATVVGPAVRV